MANQNTCMISPLFSHFDACIAIVDRRVFHIHVLAMDSDKFQRDRHVENAREYRREYTIE